MNIKTIKHLIEIKLKVHLPIGLSLTIVFESSLHRRERKKINPRLRESVQLDKDEHLQPFTWNADIELKFFLSTRLRLLYP